MSFVCKCDYRIDLNRFKSRLFLYRHKLGTNQFDEITAVKNGIILRILWHSRENFSFEVKLYRSVLRGNYHTDWRTVSWAFFFARDLTERDRDMAREVKVFIGWSFLNGIWSRLVRPRRTIERPIFIILFYSSIDYHSRRFTSITQQALRKTMGEKERSFSKGQIDLYKLVWNYRKKFLFIEYAS